MWVHTRIPGSGAADVGIVFRGAFVVVVARELIINFDENTDFEDDASNESTQERPLGLAPVMAAFIQVFFF